MVLDHSWATWVQTIAFIASSQNESILVNRMVEISDHPLQRELFSVGRFLSYGVENAPWKLQVMRLLANVLNDEMQPLGLRARALGALAISGSPGVGVLFRQLANSGEHTQRQISALGLGYVRDGKGIDELRELLIDSSLNVRRAALLALVAIGTKTSLECVADALISGDDELRRSAAEALANHPEEGYPTLKEGAFLDDVLVRKAVVSGLQRVRQPWATQIIEKLHIEDEQWVVKDAASQALKELVEPKPFIPTQIPSAYNLPWLVTFASERGIGVSPGKPALDLLKLAFREGNEEQRIAAINYIGIFGDASDVIPLYQVLYSEAEGELKEAAFSALWQRANAGVELPPPAQFGLEITY
jgi:HEAT repeat protein